MAGRTTLTLEKEPTVARSRGVCESMQRRILLVQPAYRSKYPPLGLMKISAYHKALGDFVQFVRGCDRGASTRVWDRIYVATMFSYDWDVTVRTVRFYRDNLFGSAGRIIVGGIASSLMPDDFYAETGIYPTVGCLSMPGALDSDSDLVVDAMTPDYSVLVESGYEYAYTDTYIGYATRGCIRRCEFCAVPRLEPEFVDYIDVKRWVRGIRQEHGEKQHLLLLDNNVLASRQLARIVADIAELGFVAGARLRGRLRHVDFNQGLDARLLTKDLARLLAQLPIHPFRLAYDTAGGAAASKFDEAVRMAAEAGIRVFSTYTLYNFLDHPTDLWDRLHHAVELGEALGVPISSFPMRYVPVTQRNRQHVGPQWNARYIRGVQCILNVTKGVVSSRHDFFHKAFGRDHREYLEIISMPDHYIIERSVHENNGAAAWRKLFRSLTEAQRQEVLDVLSHRTRAAVASHVEGSPSGRLSELLAHYL